MTFLCRLFDFWRFQSVGEGAFVIAMSQISSFFSVLQGKSRRVEDERQNRESTEGACSRYFSFASMETTQISVKCRVRYFSSILIDKLDLLHIVHGFAL